MKFFVDTAVLAEIEELNAYGLLDGVTTNPSLIAKSGRNFLEVIAEICRVVDGPVSAEVAAMDHAGMIAEGERLAGITVRLADAELDMLAAALTAAWRRKAPSDLAKTIAPTG